MKKLIFTILSAAGLAASAAALVSYQATAKNTPCTGYDGQVVNVQFASTNLAGTATVSAVTDLMVGGKVHSFTNEIATATLVNGMASVNLADAFVASKQRIVLTGSAFPGGSAILWIQK